MSETNTMNGDINDDSFDQSLYTLSAADMQPLLQLESHTLLQYARRIPVPTLRCIAQGLELDEPERSAPVSTPIWSTSKMLTACQGVLTLADGARNRLSVELGWDRRISHLVQNAQYGYLNTDGITITRIPVFLDGSTEVDDAPQDNRVNLHGTTNTPELLLTDTFSFGKWVLTASGRYNHTPRSITGDRAGAGSLS